MFAAPSPLGSAAPGARSPHWRPLPRGDNQIAPVTPATAGQPSRALVMAVVMTATFMAALDSSIVNIALRITLAGVGLGVGLFTTPNNSAIMGAAPRDRQGVAAALVAAARDVGMMSGVATAANLLTFWRARLVAEGAPPADALRGAMHGTLFVAATLAAIGGALCLLRPGARREDAR
jgi:hypothetical protein